MLCNIMWQIKKGYCFALYVQRNSQLRTFYQVIGGFTFTGKLSELLLSLGEMRAKRKKKCLFRTVVI